MDDEKNEKSKAVTEETPPILPKKRKKGVKFIIVLVILIIFGAVGFIFKGQIGGFLGKYLKNVPVVSKIFDKNTNEYSSISKAQLINKLENNKIEQDNLNKKIEELQQQNKGLEDKISSLKQYETKYSEFISQKEAWDEKVAKTNPDMFIEQFEKMYPETKDKIYKDIKIDSVLTNEQKEFCNTIAQMDKDKAAKALETLISTDPELIKLVFEGMDQEGKSLILSNMQPANAATVIKLLSPSQATTNE